MMKNRTIFNEGAAKVDDLSTIIHTIYSVYGFDISQYDDAFLKQTIEKRCAAIDTKKISDYAIYLSNNTEEAKNLFSALNITYTEFFRSTLTYAHLEQWILPRLIEKKSGNSELRVWSAGCSSGQEAYSIAMLVEKINEKKQQALRYRIIATDNSKSALAVAKKGDYTEEAIHNVKMKDIKEFFIVSGETYTVCDRLKKHISFSTYDLLDNRSAYPHESIFGCFDLVFCCNMLFYYKTDSQIYILKKLINSMEEHGYLITGEAEKQTVAKHGSLLTVASPSPIFQKNLEV